MERKRSWSKCFCDEEEEEKKKEKEEEEEEDEDEEEEEQQQQPQHRDRRQGLREKKRISYALNEEYQQELDNGSDTDDEDSEEEENHNFFSPGNRLLPVTCGTKKGKLDVEKLERGEDCIKHKNTWFSPNAFESLCGKSSAKKWKTSILHGDKPLQFWFEQGCLSTKGYKKRTRGKEIIIQSSDCGSETCSEEDSEIQSTKDERKTSYRLPDSKEQLLKTEKDIKDEDKGEGVKAKVQNGELEDEGLADVYEDHKLKKNQKGISSPKLLALTTKVKVLINRLPLDKFDCQINCMDSPPEAVKWVKPLDEDYEGETENSSEEENNIPEAAPDEPPDSDSTIICDIKEEKEELRPKTETPVYESVTSYLSSNNKPEEEELMNSPSAILDSSPDTVDTGEDSNMTDVQKEVGELEGLDCKKEDETKRKEHFDMSEPEDDKTSCATGKRLKTSSTSLDQLPAGEEVFKPLYLSITPPDVVGKCETNNHAKVTSPDLEAVSLQVMMPDTCTPGTIRYPDCTCPASSKVSPGSEEDTIDMNQLKREIISMQLKVLKLQEQYYTLKLREIKKKAIH